MRDSVILDHKTKSICELFANRRAFRPALRRERFGPFGGYPQGFTLTLIREGQLQLVLLPLIAHESLTCHSH
jgi:hypothetical protein